MVGGGTSLKMEDDLKKCSLQHGPLPVSANIIACCCPPTPPPTNTTISNHLCMPPTEYTTIGCASGWCTNVYPDDICLGDICQGTVCPGSHLSRQDKCPDSHLSWTISPRLMLEHASSQLGHRPGKPPPSNTIVVL